MALIACKNCGGQISDKAWKCPHCGKKLKGSSNGNPGTILLIAGFFAMAVIITLEMFEDLNWQFNLAKDIINYSLIYPDILSLIISSFLFLIPTILFIIAFFISKSKGVKYLSLLFGIACVAVSIYLIDFNYNLLYQPVIEFEKTYENANALKELNGKKIENYKGEYLSFTGDNVEIGNRDRVLFTVPVIHVDSKGNITTDIITDNTNAKYYLYIHPYSYAQPWGSDMGFRAEIYGTDKNYWGNYYENEDKKKGDFGKVNIWESLKIQD